MGMGERGAGASPLAGTFGGRTRGIASTRLGAPPDRPERGPELGGSECLRCYDKGKEYPADPESFVKALDFLTQGVERAWTHDPAQFARIWNPLGVLPPDQYLAMVIQVVEGCAWNQCAFCNLYATRPSRVRTLEEIRQHTDEVVAFFGEALAGRCSIFLGDANALQAPPSILIPAAEELAVRFPSLATRQPDGVGGMYSFAEATRLTLWKVPDLRALARAGFRRVYLGVETERIPCGGTSTSRAPPIPFLKESRN